MEPEAGLGSPSWPDRTAVLGGTCPRVFSLRTCTYPPKRLSVECPPALAACRLCHPPTVTRAFAGTMGPVGYPGPSVPSVLPCVCH